MSDIYQLPKKINEIAVSTPLGHTARLLFNRGSYQLIYDAPTSPLVSLTMPPGVKMIYQSGAIFPIFEMNIPEGFVRRHISQRLQRSIGKVTDMIFLALQQDTGIGALSYDSALRLERPQPENLTELLQWDQQDSVFEYLLDKYLLNTSISGVQPKVMLGADTKGSVLFPNLIAKAGDSKYPRLPENEFHVMSMAKACGIAVPEFYLTENRELFIIERFDIVAQRRLAMEDFCVLKMRSSEKKYQGSYEEIADAIALYTGNGAESAKFFNYVAFSCMVGNGDAHLKNYALLSESFQPEERWLAPMYDVVCTHIYPTDDHKLALSLNKSKAFPNIDGLLAFAHRLKVVKPQDKLAAMADMIKDYLAHNAIDEIFPQLAQSIRQSLSHAMSTNNVFVRFDVKRAKRRKSDKLL